jgi:hypothetical protein
MTRRLRLDMTDNQTAALRAQNGSHRFMKNMNKEEEGR